VNTKQPDLSTIVTRRSDRRRWPFRRNLVISGRFLHNPNCRPLEKQRRLIEIDERLRQREAVPEIEGDGEAVVQVIKRRLIESRSSEICRPESDRCNVGHKRLGCASINDSMGA
jgi:hypothetical protein